MSPGSRVGLEARGDERGRRRRGEAVEERQGESRLGPDQGRATSHRDSVPCAVMDTRIAIDERLVEWTPGPSIEPAPEVAPARAAVEDAARRLLRVPDDRLEAAWPWPGSTSEVDVRYGYYRLFELLEEAQAGVVASLVPSRVVPAPGGRRGAAATVARWSLHGLLLPLTDEDLDRDPGNREWTIRQTLGHMLQSQQFYGSFTAWWLTQAPTPAAVPPVALTYEVPTEADQSAGSLMDIRGRLDALLDLAMARLGGLDETQIAVPARWSGRRGHGRVPDRAVGVAHPGAHDPDRQDARDARPADDRGRAARPDDRRGVRAARGDGVRARCRRCAARGTRPGRPRPPTSKRSFPGSSTRRRRTSDRPRDDRPDGRAVGRAHPVDLPHTAQRPGISSRGTPGSDG